MILPSNPAFPGEGQERGFGSDGMSYRDWLLGQVAAGICSSCTASADDPHVADAIAREAFQVTNALLRIRTREWRP